MKLNINGCVLLVSIFINSQRKLFIKCSGDNDQPYILGYYSLDGIVAGPVKKYQYPEGLVKPTDWEVLMARAEALSSREEHYRSMQVYNSIFTSNYLYGRMSPNERYQLHLSLGKALIKIGMLERAETTLYEASSLHPEPHEAHFILSQLKTHEGNIQQATMHLKNCLYYQPQNTLALKNLGSVLYASGRLVEGTHYLRRLALLEKERNYLSRRLSVDTNTSNISESTQNYAPSVDRWVPTFILEAFSLNSKRNGSLSDAEAEVLLQFVDFPTTSSFFAIGLGLWRVGAWELSEFQMRSGLDVSRKEDASLITALKLRMGLNFPSVLTSMLHLEEAWGKLVSSLNELIEELEYKDNLSHFSINVLGALHLLHEPIFLLYWQAIPMKSVTRLLEELFEGACNELRIINKLLQDVPAADFLSTPYGEKLHEELLLNEQLDKMEGPKYSGTSESSSLPKRRRRRHTLAEEASEMKSTDVYPVPTQKIAKKPAQVNVGIVSCLFYTHPVGRVALNIVHSLKSSRVNFTLFCCQTYYDEVTHFLRQIADQFVILPFNISRAASMISSWEPGIDILLYPDWTDSLTYFLAYSRLAPIQAAFWVRGSSLGLRSIDYYFVGEIVTTSNNMAVNRHYTEQVIELEGLGWPPISFVPFSLPHPVYEFHGHIFFDSQHLYTVAVPAQQLHPQFDAVLIKILQEDPDALLIILVDPSDEMAGPTGIVYRRLVQRISKKLTFAPGMNNRIRVLSLLNHRERLTFLLAADVVLDPFPISAPITVMEALLQTGTPVVSLSFQDVPHTFHFSFGSEICTKMGIGSYCAARSIEEYASFALKIGCNESLQQEVKQKIKQATAMFQRSEYASDFQSALQNIAQGAAQTRISRVQLLKSSSESETF